MLGTRTGSAVVGMVIWMAVACQAAGPAKVFIKRNATDPTAGDVYVMKSPGAKSVKLRTVSNAYLRHYHAADYKNGSLYVINRIGYISERDYRDNWTDELWRYTGSGDRGTKLFAARNLDFRVRDDGGMIAVLAPVTPGKHQRSLHLLGRDGKVLKAWSPKQLNCAGFDFLKWGWVGSDLWLKDQEAFDIYGFVRVDSRSMSTAKYDVTRLSLADQDFDLNTSSLRLAYSDYPVTFDIDSYRQIQQRKTPVKLYVHGLQTKRSRIIASSVAKVFRPKWVSSSVLEYDNPKGNGRVRRAIR